MKYTKCSESVILDAVDWAIEHHKKILLAYTGKGDYKVKIKAGILGFGERKYLASPEVVEKIKDRLRERPLPHA